MAATVGATKAYDLRGAAYSAVAVGPAKEDLDEMIYDISPMDAWFLSNAKRGTAKSTLHEWLTDSLTAAASNAAVEGDAFSATARTLPSRLKNYTQIARRGHRGDGHGTSCRQRRHGEDDGLPRRPRRQGNQARHGA